MDQMGKFFVFCVTGEKFNEFWIPEVLNRYLESTGLRGTDYIFHDLEMRKARWLPGCILYKLHLLGFTVKRLFVLKWNFNFGRAFWDGGEEHRQ